MPVGCKDFKKQTLSKIGAGLLFYISKAADKKKPLRRFLFPKKATAIISKKSYLSDLLQRSLLNGKVPDELVGNGFIRSAAPMTTGVC